MVTVRILVVEDDSQSLYLARFLLEKAGHEVIEAQDGETAVIMAAEEEPELILMDMLLPRLDGYEATKQIRGLSSKVSDVPVVALTAYSMKGDSEKGMAAGCSGYIPKPINPSTFVAEVMEYLVSEV